MKSLTLLLFTLLPLHLAQAKNPVEVGTVTWGRDLAAGLAEAKKSGKPVFLLFQEVPGCAGCRQFGQDVLSDPEVVGLIEKNFIPVLIHNNKGGKDAEILKAYGEPAWNYQVVRFLDSAGKDLIPRKDRVWTAPELKTRIAAALEADGKNIVAQQVPKLARLALCQHCFWTGEMKIGAFPGVTQTQAGFIGGREVTLVEYNQGETSLLAILKKAKAEGVATALYLDNPKTLSGAKQLEGYRAAPASDQKRQIQGTAFAKLDLTPEQATKVNAFARTDPAKALTFLTPAQRKKLGR